MNEYTNVSKIDNTHVHVNKNVNNMTTTILIPQLK